MSEAFGFAGIVCDGGCARELVAGEWTWLCTECDHEVCVGCADCARSRKRSRKGEAREAAGGKLVRPSAAASSGGGRGTEGRRKRSLGRGEGPSADGWPEGRRKARKRQLAEATDTGS